MVTLGDLVLLTVDLRSIAPFFQHIKGNLMLVIIQMVIFIKDVV